jgi:hypothetical protein
MSKPEWDDIAAAIRGMTIPELGLFQEKYGISIVSQDTKKMKKFDDMSLAEKREFLAHHKIKPEDVGL